MFVCMCVYHVTVASRCMTFSHVASLVMYRMFAGSVLCKECDLFCVKFRRQDQDQGLDFPDIARNKDSDFVLKYTR